LVRPEPDPASELSTADVVIVGAGAAGIATAIFIRRANPARAVVLLDGARKPGAKILVSGGARCNVTNRVVSDRDFWGGRRPAVRRILRAFTAADTVRFFHALGVPLHEEADGKLFPDSNRSRDVLAALLRGVDAAGARLLTDHRVLDVRTAGRAAAFAVTTGHGEIGCRHLVLATGGESLPKTGSDGAGFQFAQRFGHTIVPTTPALVPLLLDDTDGAAIHRELSGVSHHVALHLWIDGRIAERQQGSLLWTHFGISGPVALNMSRHWLRADREGRSPRLTASFAPASSFDRLDAMWTELAASRPKSSLLAALSAHVPGSVAAAMLGRLQIDGAGELAHVTRAERRRLVHGLVEWPLAVTGCRGYNYAEATAGGVALDEINPATMESRAQPGLYLVGEILDVDGRIGGFNFQWAWSTAYVAGQALAAGTP
jgi:predicted Rossmann fold flavoprotein